MVGRTAKEERAGDWRCETLLNANMPIFLKKRGGGSLEIRVRIEEKVIVATSKIQVL